MSANTLSQTWPYYLRRSFNVSQQNQSMSGRCTWFSTVMVKKVKLFRYVHSSFSSILELCGCSSPATSPLLFQHTPESTSPRSVVTHLLLSTNTMKSRCCARPRDPSCIYTSRRGFCRIWNGSWWEF